MGGCQEHSIQGRRGNGRPRKLKLAEECVTGVVMGSLYPSARRNQIMEVDVTEWNSLQVRGFGYGRTYCIFSESMVQHYKFNHDIVPRSFFLQSHQCLIFKPNGQSYNP